MQTHSVGMFRLRKEFAAILKELLGDRSPLYMTRAKAQFPICLGFSCNEFLFGNSDPVVVTENGFKFRIDWTTGQKTGFFIDQRENRKLLGEYTNGRSVLNMFGYTGGFSVYAMKMQSLFILSTARQSAIDMANENIKLNYGDDPRHESFKVDAFDFLNDIKDIYDLIILDPPAFAKHQNVLANALQGYKRLNIKAIEQIKPGGIFFIFLFTGCDKGEFQEVGLCSCSQYRSQGENNASDRTACRSPGEYLSSGKRVSEGSGNLCE